jgi:hypothetical protein
MVAIVLGVILVIAGIIGFVPNPIAYSENAIFTVNAAHNVVHIVSGLFLLAGAFTGLGSVMALRILGIVYVVVAVLGFVSGDMILGFIQNNAGDNWLHVVLAIVLLAAGFGMADRQMSPAM